MSKKETELGSYKLINGDVFEEFFNSKGNSAFLHGANCHKIMGAGVALEVRKQLTPLYFLDFYDMRTPTQRLGSYSATILAQTEKGFKIGVNLYSQFKPGPNFSLTAFKNSLTAFKETIPSEERKDLTLYLPKIGCGIGEGSWEEIEPAIKEEFKEFTVIVVNLPEKKVIKVD